MIIPKPVEFDLTHPGTHRRATVQHVQDYGSPISVAEGKYVLVIGVDKLPALSIKLARAWVDAGASFICAWGHDCDAVEESFDYAAFLLECGQPLPFTLMTTSHKEALDQALWFAFYNAHAQEDCNLQAFTTPVVVIVDSDVLFKQCAGWITNNTK